MDEFFHIHGNRKTADGPLADKAARIDEELAPKRAAVGEDQVVQPVQAIVGIDEERKRYAFVPAAIRPGHQLGQRGAADDGHVRPEFADVADRAVQRQQHRRLFHSVQIGVEQQQKRFVLMHLRPTESAQLPIDHGATVELRCSETHHDHDGHPRSQTVKTTEIGGVHGYDGGKKVNGRKRHIVVDTLGLLLAVAVTSAALDDGSHAWQVLRKLSAADYPRLWLLWADSKYQNHSLQAWLKQHRAAYEIEVVSRPIGVKGFVLLHRRWVVERSIAWLNRYRRLSKEYGYYTESSEAQIQISSMQLMLRRLKPNKGIQRPAFKYPKKLKKAV